MNLDLSSIARRVARRVLAERGRGGRAPEPGAVPGSGPGAGPPLLTASCLLHTPDGARLPVPPGTLITPLAREEAWRRRITLDGEGGGGGAR